MCWPTPSGASGVRLVAPRPGDRDVPVALAGLHPTRSAQLVADGTLHRGGRWRSTPAWPPISGSPTPVGPAPWPRRIGWLEVDLGLLFDDRVVPRRAMVAAAVSRFPSSDIDLALVVDDAIPADLVADVLGAAAGDLLESVTLFDVFRGPAHRRRQAQPGLPAAFLFARPHLDRRRGGRTAGPVHRRRRGRGRRRPALRPLGAWHRGPVGPLFEVEEIDPHERAAFDAWFAVMQATDAECWPDGPGWQRVERLAMALDEDGPEEHRLVVARDGDGSGARDRRHRALPAREPAAGADRAAGAPDVPSTRHRERPAGRGRAARRRGGSDRTGRSGRDAGTGRLRGRRRTVCDASRVHVDPADGAPPAAVAPQPAPCPRPGRQPEGTALRLHLAYLCRTDGPTS